MSKRYLLYVADLYALPILRPLQKAILQRGDEVRWFMESSAHSTYLETDEQQLPTIDAIRAWNPYAVLVPGNWVPHFIPGIKVEIFHGIGAKSKKNGNDRGHYRIRGYFDLYCTHGPETTAGFLSLQKKHPHFAVRETGWSKMDGIFSADTLPASDRPRVLFCSTFTPDMSCAADALPILQELSQRGDMEYFTTLHPKIDPQLIQQYRESDNDSLHFIESHQTPSYMRSADVMICDNSSMMIEFLLLGKTVISVNNPNPGLQFINIPDVSKIEEALGQAFTPHPQRTQAIASIKKQQHPYDDAQSSLRILKAIDDVVTNELNTLQSKPWNILRKFKMRKRLKYWK